ncbi:MAG: hypothetical protein N2511_02250 [Thermodesulfovibrionales bacterium]|nr:hypothetical protein [Thermodesulfovibrionales bacterium]
MAISFLLVIIIVVIYSLQNQETKVTLIFDSTPQLEDLIVKHQREGMVKWLVTAKKAILTDSNNLLLEDLEISFPERDFILFSKGGIYNLVDQSLKIEGQIRALTKNYVIDAVSLSWDPKAGLLSSDKKIVIEGKDFSIEGDEFSASSSKAFLKNNVKAIFR